MHIESFIQRLEQEQILLKLEGNVLKVSSRNGSAPSQLLEEIRQYRHDLIRHLRKNGNRKKQQKIPLAERREHYDTSHAQKRLWIISRMKGTGGAYNIAEAFFINGALNQTAFTLTFGALVSRHESLRTVFLNIEGEPRQKILAPGNIPCRIDFTDLRGEATGDEGLRAYMEKEALLPFNLEKGPLFRVRVLQLTDYRHLFLFTIHHIISDGWSSTIFTREMLELYGSFCRNGGNELDPLPVQYKDFAAWQNNRLKGRSLEDHRRFWLDRFHDGVPILNMPLDFSRPAVKKYEGDTWTGQLGMEITRDLRTLARVKGVTPFMTLLAILNALLYKYTGQTKIVIGSPIAGRDHVDLTGQIGFFVNTLALRFDLSGEDTFDQLLDKVKETTLNAYDHQLYPFDQLIDDLKIARDLSRNPLFDVAVTIGNIEGGAGDNEGPAHVGQNIENANSGSPVSKFDLNFDFFEAPQDIRLSITYDRNLFRKETIGRMFTRFRTIAAAALGDTGVALRSMEWLGDEEKALLLGSAREPAFATPPYSSIQERIGERVFLQPEAPAVVSGSLTLSYGELNARAGKLARLLRDRYGAGPGALIGVMPGRTEQMVITLLAVLKAGAAYVPIDPAYPSERIGYIIADSGIDLLLSERQFAKYHGNIQTLYTDEIPGCHAEEGSADLPALTQPDHPAYVIYTSGSTGKPKGVVITHANALALLQWAGQEFRDSAFDTVFAATSYCFDLSVFEIFYTLSAGKRIRVLGSGLEIAEWLGRDRRVLVNTVPSVVDALLKAQVSFREVALLNMAGEPIPMHVKEALDTGSMELRNLYGPSEDTTYSSCYRLRPGDGVIPIGKPLPGTRFFILGEDRNLLPPGLPGEIVISGAGLAPGYLNRPELTAAKFIVHPSIEGERLYLTGDIGVLQEDGHFSFLGRRDNQVKIRGYRIEMGEVETALAACPGIVQVLVDAWKNDEGEKFLVAYYTGQEQTRELLENFLGKRLPEYMLPSFFIYLAAWPLTPNGKIDRTALPGPLTTTSPQEGRMEPRDQREADLLLIWRSLLGRDRIGIRENFFSVGGHSLKATRLLFQVARHFGVELDLTDIFSYPTIEELAKLIARSAPGVRRGIERLPEQEYYPVSHAQKRLWVINQVEETLTAYNIPFALRIKGALDLAALNFAIQAVSERHEILRTSFRLVKGQVMQRVHEPGLLDIGLEFRYLRGQDAGKKLEGLLQKEEERIFDLGKGPLFAARLYQLQENDFLFVLNMHHIISDGWSMEVLARDILGSYKNYLDDRSAPAMPAPLRIQYRDYAAWQNEQLSGDQLLRHRQYWMEQMTDLPPAADLFPDFERPPFKTYHGGIVTDHIGAADYARIRAFCHAQELTPFMFLLSCLNALLNRYTGREDLVIGSPVAGREHADLEDQVGFYANTLVLRTRFSAQTSFRELAGRVKSITLEAFEHQVYPFDLLVEELQPERDLSRNPLFEIMITMQQSQGAGAAPEAKVRPALAELVLEPVHPPSTTSKFDLTLNIEEERDGLGIGLVYNTDIYTARTMQRVLAHFSELTGQVLENAEMTIRDIALEGLSQPGNPQIMPSGPKTPVPEIRPGRQPAGVSENRTGKQQTDSTGTREGEPIPIDDMDETEQQLREIWMEVLGRDRVGVNDNFFAMGGHSLKILQMQAMITGRFGMDIRIRDIFMRPTIRGLASWMNGSLSMQIVPDLHTDNAGINLFCIPFGGGGKHVFQGFRQHLVEGCHLFPLELPGRGERAGELLLTTVDEMLEDLYAQIRSQLDRPYAIFGHSLGALLGYLLALKILKEGDRKPEHLFISSCLSPEKYRDLDPADAAAMRDYFENDLGMGSQMAAYIEPIFTADCRAVADLDLPTHAKLDIPATLIRGDEETMQDKDMEGWKERFADCTGVLHVSGDHYHLLRQAAPLMEIMQEHLLEGQNS